MAKPFEATGMIRAAAGHLARIVPVGIPVPVVRGPLRGSVWYAGSLAGEGRGLSVCFNLYEPEQLKRAFELSKGASNCFDIGANVGLYSLLFARNCNRVFAFEPLPRNIMWLSRVLERNAIRNVTVIPAAVSDNPGLLHFDDGINSAQGAVSAAGSRPVVSVNIDAFSEKFETLPTLIKIDVEGAELGVLRGGRRTLERHKPAILLSTHGDSAKNACLEYLSLIGYGRLEPIDSQSLDTATEFCVLP